MSLVRLSLRNVRRAPLRTALTVISGAICLITFVMLRLISESWTNQVKETPNDRVVTRNRLGRSRSMPLHYLEDVRQLPGVKLAMAGSWANLRFPSEPRLSFVTNAFETKPFIDMHYELSAPAEQKQEFLEDRRGAFVSDELARELGWRVGDVLQFKGGPRDSNVELHVSGIFHSTRHGFARRTIYFHWEYWNELLPEHERDRINIIASQVVDPKAGAAVARAIDMHFDGSIAQTSSQEDQAFNAQLVGRFSAVLSALDLVSTLILGVLVLILANTVTMSVRERRKELATLRAIGFGQLKVATFMLGEAMILGFASGLVCLALSVPLTVTVLRPVLGDVLRLAPVRLTPLLCTSALSLGGLAGLAAAAVPTWRSASVAIIDALRRVN